jgi:ribosomal protein S18 acetylase RimI-like enzyme
MRSTDVDAMLRIRLDWLSQQFDAAEITELERAWFARYPGNTNASALVAEDSDQIVGYLLCVLTTHPTAVGISAEIDEVCVAEEYRRQSIGARLVAELRQRLLSSVGDLSTIQARVDRADDRSQAFLRAQGFEHDLLEFTDYLE